jgi:hypothetical protein
MFARWLTRAFITYGCGVLVATAAQTTANAQEWLPNPALTPVRASATENGGIEWEWQFHMTQVGRKIPPVAPISKFAGGRGMCTPPCVAPYYGCDTSSGCRRTGRCGCR